MISKNKFGRKCGPEVVERVRIRDDGLTADARSVERQGVALRAAVGASSKYQRWHDAIIDRARSRVRTADDYLERHHVVPRCMGGTDEARNLVYLTPEEHYVVHQLLVKVFPDHSGLIYAAVTLTLNRHGGRTNNKLYGWLKRALSLSMRGNQRTRGKRFRRPLGFRTKISASHTPERRAALSALMRGNKYGLGNKSTRGRKLGDRLSPEGREALRQRMIGNKNTKGRKLPPRTPEHIAKFKLTMAARSAALEAGRGAH